MGGTSCKTTGETYTRAKDSECARNMGDNIELPQHRLSSACKTQRQHNTDERLAEVT